MRVHRGDHPPAVCVLLEVNPSVLTTNNTLGAEQIDLILSEAVLFVLTSKLDVICRTVLS